MELASRAAFPKKAGEPDCLLKSSELETSEMQKFTL